MRISDWSSDVCSSDLIAVRYRAVLFGGAMAGLGGAFLSLSYTPMWAEGMTAGRGWIALALVVFASWRPWPLLPGPSSCVGGPIAQLYPQGTGGFGTPSQFMSIIPSLATTRIQLRRASCRP